MAITLHLIAWLVCVTETDCVVCDKQAKVVTADCTCCEVPAPAEATVEQEHRAWVTENVEYLCLRYNENLLLIYTDILQCVLKYSVFFWKPFMQTNLRTIIEQMNHKCYAM